MALSRLRLRLGAWFALAYLVGLLAINLSLYAFLHVQSEHRLTRELQARGEELRQAITDELIDVPDSGLSGAATEVIREWTGPPGAYVVLDSTGIALAQRGPDPWLAAGAILPPGPAVRDLPIQGDDPIRRVEVQHLGRPPFTIVVMESVAGITEDNETLAFWLGLSAVAVLLLGLGGGYVLSSRALIPIDTLGDAIAGISATSLGSRLAITDPPDEVDRVGAQFNSLLARLEQAQLQNRQFLREAAHQIRTPLTLVMGEASLELEQRRGKDSDVLRRIQLAAEQMQRRVLDLFLLAEARAGTPPALDTPVELDGLLLEAADAMRSRAHQFGRQLRFAEVAPTTLMGNRGLLLEGILELLENAVRHGTTGTPVTLSVESDGTIARLRIASAGAPFAIRREGGDAMGDTDGHGLGLAIVHWIAELHGGHLELDSTAGINLVTLTLPAGAK